MLMGTLVVNLRTIILQIRFFSCNFVSWVLSWSYTLPLYLYSIYMSLCKFFCEKYMCDFVDLIFTANKRTTTTVWV